MNRDNFLKQKRTKFVQLTDTNPQKAALELHEMATALGNCKKMSDKIFALSQIFCVSESTIEKEFYGR
jgi:hypothetical protein